MGNQHKLSRTGNRRGGQPKAVGATWNVATQTTVTAGVHGIIIDDGDYSIFVEDPLGLVEVLRDAYIAQERNALVWAANSEPPKAVVEQRLAEEIERVQVADDSLDYLKAMLARQPDDEDVCTVVIDDGGPRKIGVVKELRQHAFDNGLKLDLHEAFRIVDSPRSEVPGQAMRGRAEELADKLREYGATVSVVPIR